MFMFIIVNLSNWLDGVSTYYIVWKGATEMNYIFNSYDLSIIQFVYLKIIIWFLIFWIFEYISYKNKELVLPINIIFWLMSLGFLWLSYHNFTLFN